MTKRKFTTTDRTAAKPIVAMTKTLTKKVNKKNKKKLEIINSYVNMISFEGVDGWFDFNDDLRHHQQCSFRPISPDPTNTLEPRYRSGWPEGMLR